MFATLRQRNFALLWVAGLISVMGNWMLALALPIVVYELTESTLAVSGMVLAGTLPVLLFSSAAGIYIDRWERRRVMVVVNVLLAASILPLLLVKSVEHLWLVYAVRFVQSGLNQFFSPAENAMLPLLSKPELLVSANALNALNNNLARLIGPALGGVVAATAGLEGVVLFDVLTYLVAAVLTLAITVTSHPGKVNAEEAAGRNLWAEWLEGLRLIWRERTVRILFLFDAITSVGESVMSVLFVPFVLHVLRGGDVHVGGLMSAQAVGGILGGLIISWVATRVNTARLLAFSAILFGMVDLILFNYARFIPGVELAYLMIMLAGPLAVGIGAGYNTLMQQYVTDAYRGRVFGTLNLTSALSMLLGIGISGFGGDAIGIVPIINIQGYGYMLGGLLCLMFLGMGMHLRTLEPALEP